MTHIKASPEVLAAYRDEATGGLTRHSNWVDLEYAIAGGLNAKPAADRIQWCREILIDRQRFPYVLPRSLVETARYIFKELTGRDDVLVALGQRAT